MWWRSVVTQHSAHCFEERFSPYRCISSVLFLPPRDRKMANEGSRTGTGRMWRLALFAGLAVGCGRWHEGMRVGECIDGIDNDGNDTVDCADPGCHASPDCTEADSSVEANPKPDDGGTGGGGSDGASDPVDDWEITEDIWDDSCNRNGTSLPPEFRRLGVVSATDPKSSASRGGKNPQRVGNYAEYDGYNNRWRYGLPETGSRSSCSKTVANRPKALGRRCRHRGHSTSERRRALRRRFRHRFHGSPLAGVHRRHGGRAGEFIACPSGEDPDATC